MSPEAKRTQPLLIVLTVAALYLPGVAVGNEPRRGAGADVTWDDVYPILLLRCRVCHGPRRQEAKLDLGSRASILAGGKSGPAMVPGKPEESLLLQRIVAEEMPPRRRLVEVSVKTMRPAEVEVLRRWIARGAPLAPPARPATVDDRASSDVDEKARNFWSFRPPAPVIDVPEILEFPERQRARCHNPIDAFILEKLAASELDLAPDAGRLVLMRRAYLDLTGLPPEPAEVEAFLADTETDDQVHEKLVDRLLLSPRYGERWGRHWLDVAGYSDSEGKTEQDMVRPHAWRYRDYVVRSFNADKPHDRFLLEQIAGDELADYEGAAEITRTLEDNLVATGFLRMGPDGTWANITAFVPDRLEVIADAIDVLGSSVLGLTLKCARCHAHKLEPIPQHDYYRIAAALRGAYDEHDWLKPNGGDDPSRRYLSHVTTAERHEWESRVKVLDGEIAPLREALAARAKSLAARLGKAADVSHDELGKSDPAFKKLAAETAEKIKALEGKKPRRPMIRALWDRGIPSPTYLLARGNYLSPGEVVSPGVVSVLNPTGRPLDARPPWLGSTKTGRRLALARWFVSPDHPLTARVLVNRIWKHHFSNGIVKSVGNFGKSGVPPTHPELLDWLARELIRSGWSVKTIHRLIMTSSTYRQSSAISPPAARLDAANTLLSRFPLKRVEAEVLRDTLLLVAGRLDETAFGPPDPVDVRRDGLVTSVGTAQGWRRSVYVQQRRKQLPTILESFDLPQMNPNCLERPNSTVATQALHLLNSAMIQNLATSFAGRIAREVGVDPVRQIDRLYLTALSRPPEPEERRLMLDTLVKLTAAWSEDDSDAASPPDPTLRALANVCHTIFNSAEFLYVD